MGPARNLGAVFCDTVGIYAKFAALGRPAGIFLPQDTFTGYIRRVASARARTRARRPTRLRRFAGTASPTISGC